MMLAQPPKGVIRVRKSQAKTAALGALHKKKQEPLPALSAPHAGQNGAKNVQGFHRLAASSVGIPIPVSLEGFLEMIELTPHSTSSCLLTSSHVGCQCLASIRRKEVTSTSTTTLTTTRTRTDRTPEAIDFHGIIAKCS